jgi:hypothetical protein
MYALTLKTRKQLERATLRAQSQKPRIEEVVFGIYKAWSTNPKTPDTYYSVGIEPAQYGGYDVCCSCPTQKFFCKHVAACMPHYQMREKEQPDWQAIEEAAETEAMHDAIREMLQAEKDKLDIFG